MPTPDPSTLAPQLPATRVALVGRWAGMSKREAQQLLRTRGAVVVDPRAADVQWIVVGESDLALGSLSELVDDRLRTAVDQGTLEILTESQLWQRLGLVERESNVHRLYTPAMLADLLGVSVAVVRGWQRRGLVVPARQVGRLPYFDFQEVATARQLAEWLAGGMSPRMIERQLQQLARLVPGVQRPLAQLPVIVEGGQLLLRQGGGLLDAGGQMRFDFEATAPDATLALADTAPGSDAPHAPQELLELAAELEESGRLAEAMDVYHVCLAAEGPRPEVCFLLAELLYRLGDVSAARERYYMAVELDEDYVEARANLGCVLAETGRLDLAVAAFEGALAHHAEYPDAHYHLARTLDDLGRRHEAESHWRSFAALAPDSPWAVAARGRLGLAP